MTSADVVPPVMSIREGLEPARRLTYVAPSGHYVNERPTTSPKWHCLPSRVAHTFTPKAMQDLTSVVERCLDGTGSLNGALLQIWITGTSWHSRSRYMKRALALLPSYTPSQPKWTGPPHHIGGGTSYGEQVAVMLYLSAPVHDSWSHRSGYPRD